MKNKNNGQEIYTQIKQILLRYSRTLQPCACKHRSVDTGKLWMTYSFIKPTNLHWQQRPISFFSYQPANQIPITDGVRRLADKRQGFLYVATEE